MIRMLFFSIAPNTIAFLTCMTFLKRLCEVVLDRAGATCFGRVATLLATV